MENLRSCANDEDEVLEDTEEAVVEDTEDTVFEDSADATPSMVQEDDDAMTDDVEDVPDEVETNEVIQNEQLIINKDDFENVGREDAVDNVTVADSTNDSRINVEDDLLGSDSDDDNFEVVIESKAEENIDASELDASEVAKPEKLSIKDQFKMIEDQLRGMEDEED